MLVRSKAQPIQDLCDMYDLKQLICKPTNSTIHGKTLIDIILTNVPDSCKISGTEFIGISDSHNLIYAILNSNAPRLPAKTITYRNYKTFQLSKYIQDVSLIPGTASQLFEDPSDNYWAFQSLLLEVINQHAPVKTVKVRAREAPFMNKRFRNAIRDKTRLYRRFKRCPTNENWELYRQQRNLTTSLRRTAIKQYFSSKCDGGNKNPDFWKTVKPFFTNKGSTNSNPICINGENGLLTDPKLVANEMNNFYVTIASQIGDNIPLTQDAESNLDFVKKCSTHFKNHPSISNIRSKMDKHDYSLTHTNSLTVEKVIKNLDTSKATGCDAIPARLLKPVAANLSQHITCIFNQSIDNCVFPWDAKLADVVPLFKKGDNLVIKNYRPLSILPCMSKILERLMHQQLLPFLDNILHPSIAAFRKGHSCQDVLLHLVDDWKSQLESKNYVGAILTDLSKAFDCLPHQLLTAKFAAYGLDDASCALLWSYLDKRYQRVKLSGSYSNWLQISKGVPQGSVMGPVMFNVFVNDLYASITRCSLINYADDNTLSAHGTAKHTMTQVLTSQSEVAIRWFRDNYMEANASKFQSILLNEPTENYFYIDGTSIPSSEVVTLLGVTIDNRLTFTPHINKLCRRAAAQLSVLQRLHKFLDFRSRLTVFKTFIRSHFSYCHIVWHFCGSVNTQKLERIQHRALKFVFNDRISSYEELLKRANICTLELSRKRAILLEVYKSVKHLSPRFLWDIFTAKEAKYNLRKQNQLSRNCCRTNRFGLNTFKDYGAKLWNTIPDNIKSKDLDGFKLWLETWSG